MTVNELESLDIIRPARRGQCPPAIRMWVRGRTPYRGDSPPRLGKTWAEVPGSRKIADHWRPGRVRLHMENLGSEEVSVAVWPWVLGLVGVLWVGFVLWTAWRGVG